MFTFKLRLLFSSISNAARLPFNFSRHNFWKRYYVSVPQIVSENIHYTGREEDSLPIEKEEFEKLFNPCFQKKAFPRSLVVAVSGGCDSLALCLLLDGWAKEKSIDLFATTVDHRIRSESTEEASLVHSWLSNRGISHSVLTMDWGSEVPSTKMDVLRRKRLFLLGNFAYSRSVPVLALAHHAGDQLETFFIRFSCYSNVDGLACMEPVSHLYQHPMITVVRPLLSIPKSRLAATCLLHSQPWVEDPSNSQIKYFRSRVRLGIQSAPPGLAKDVRRLIDSCNDLVAENHDRLRSMFRYRLELDRQFGFFTLYSHLMIDLNFSLAFRLFGHMVQSLSGRRPKLSQYQRLYSELMNAISSRSPYNCSIGFCLFEYSPRKSIIHVSRQTPYKHAIHELKINTSIKLGCWFISYKRVSPSDPTLIYIRMLESSDYDQYLDNYRKMELKRKNLSVRLLHGVPVFFSRFGANVLAIPHFDIYFGLKKENLEIVGFFSKLFDFDRSS